VAGRIKRVWDPIFAIFFEFFPAREHFQRPDLQNITLEMAKKVSVVGLWLTQVGAIKKL